MNSQKIEPLVDIISKDCGDFASLLDLLSEHAVVSENGTLTGAVAALKSQFITIWDKLEAEVSNLAREAA